MFATDDQQGVIYAIDSSGAVVDTFDIPGTGLGIAVDPYYHETLNPKPSIVFSTSQNASTAIYREDMFGSEQKSLFDPVGKILHTQKTKTNNNNKHLGLTPLIKIPHCLIIY